jgi:cation diffusion facilitator family transporter
MRVMSPVPIHFTEAIPIAVLGLLVNIASAWLLGGGDHHHGHSHSHDAHAGAGHDEESKSIETPDGLFALSIFEDGVPPVFRLQSMGRDRELPAECVTVTTIRPGGARQTFRFSRKAGYLESTDSIPEPHAFKALLTLPSGAHDVEYAEHGHEDFGHGVDARDHNIRAAYIHVMADAAVSVLAIIGLSLARIFGWLWMDPLAGILGAFVIANWSYGLVRDTGAILLDMNPSDTMAGKVRATVDAAGDRLIDLHIWRLGPGHFGAIVSVVGDGLQRGPDFYHAALRRIKGLSHITVEVHTARETV